MKQFLKILAAVMVIAMVAGVVGCETSNNNNNNAGNQDVTEAPGGDNESILRTPGVLTVGADIGYPPMEYYEEDGVTPIGFDIDVGKAIAELLSLEYEIIDTAWDGIFAGVDRGDYDVIISSVSITPEREENYIFTKPYIANALCLVVPTGFEGTVSNTDDFAGLKIAVQDETTADIALSAMVEEGLDVEIFRYPQVINCFDDLITGRVDAVYVDSVVAAFYTTGSDEFYRIWISDVDEPLGLCLSKGSQELRDAVCAAIDMLYYNGTMEEIGRLHFGDDFIAARVVTQEPVIPAIS
jgi:polar amino acid transport system substrate-binding protein